VNQKLISILLKNWGHQVAIAANGQQALDLLEANPYDLILMDMQMPVMGGLEATRLIRQREAAHPALGKAPIYALTAAAMADEQQAALEAGVDGYLTKPIDKRQLQEILSQQIAIGAQPQPLHPPPAADETTNAFAECDADVLDIIGQDFLAGAPGELAAIVAAFNAAAWPVLERLAHAQKGIVCNFGAHALEHMLLELEQTCRKRTPPPTQLLTDLQREWNNLYTALGHYLAQKPSLGP